MYEKNTTAKMIKSIFSVSGILIIGKLIGFIKQAICANYFGATINTDIISLSEGIINDVDYMIVQALTSSFVPIYIGIRETQKERGGERRFLSDTILAFTIITGIIVVVMELGANFLSSIIAPSYSGEMARMLSFYIRLFAPLIIVIVWIAIFNATLKANGSFVLGESISIIQSVITILLAVTIGARFGADTIAIAFFSYTIIDFVLLGGSSKKYWSLIIRNPFKEKEIQELLKMMLPLLFGYSMVFLNQQVDKILVSGLESGTVTAMQYAAVLSNFITAILGSVCSVLFTYIAESFSKGNQDRVAKIINLSGLTFIVVLLPISIVTVFNANDIVKIVFGRGAYVEKAVSITAYALIGYAFMFVPIAIKELFSRLMYSYKNTKQPTINGTIGCLINIGLSIILCRNFGVLGVSFATSIAVLVNAVLNVVSSRKYNKLISLKNYNYVIPFLVLGCMFCVLVCFMGKKYMVDLSPIKRLISITIISVGVYSIFVIPKMLRIIKDIKSILAKSKE